MAGHFFDLVLSKLSWPKDGGYGLVEAQGKIVIFRKTCTSMKQYVDATTDAGLDDQQLFLNHSLARGKLHRVATPASSVVPCGNYFHDGVTSMLANRVKPRLMTETPTIGQTDPKDDS